MFLKITIEEMCTKLRPIIGDDADKLYSKYRLATTPKERADIEQLITALYQKNIGSLLEKRILLTPPTKDLTAEFPIGIVKYADKDISIFGLRDKDWVRHVLISGMSGSGKTNLAFHIIGNFIVKNKPFLVLDWKKSFRPLYSMTPDILCFTVGNEKVSNFFRTNINIPPKNIPAKEWVNIICDIITEAFHASFGVHKILSETMDETFRKAGIYDGSENYPTWYDIKLILEEKADILKGREAEWLASSMRIAHVLTFGSFGNAINDKHKTFKIEDLFDKKVIFELNSLNNSEKKFFAQYLLTYIYKLKKSSDNQSTEDFKYAIIVDEAHNIFLRQETSFITENVTDMIYREVREYGISLVCLDQHASKLSDTVAGNSATIIAFQQILPADVDIMSKTMLIDDKYYFSLLPVGHAIVKLAERYYEPFLIKVPLVNLKREIILDEEIRNIMMRKLGFLENHNSDNSKISIIYDNENKTNDDEINSNSEPKTKDVYGIDEIKKSNSKKLYRDDEILRVIRIRFKELLDKGYNFEDIKTFFKERYDKKLVDTAIESLKPKKKTDTESFLEYIKNNPGCMVTDIYKALNLTARKGNDIKNSLAEKGIIEIKQTATNKGVKKKVYLSDKGLKLV